MPSIVPLIAFYANLMLLSSFLGPGAGALRLLWTLVVVPLPVFFAGIIFSTTFRRVAIPSAAFGANLMGAMVGGFCEYLAMAVGSKQLSVLIFVAYLFSLLVLLVAKRRGLSF